MRSSLFMIILLVAAGFQSTWAQTPTQPSNDAAETVWSETFHNWTLTLERTGNQRRASCQLYSRWDDDRGPTRILTYIPEAGALIYWQRADLPAIPAIIGEVSRGSVRIELDRTVFAETALVTPKVLDRAGGTEGTHVVLVLRGTRKVDFFGAFIGASRAMMTLPNGYDVGINLGGISAALDRLSKCFDEVKVINDALPNRERQGPGR